VIRQAAAIDRQNVLTRDVNAGNITVGGSVLGAGSGTLRW
jgi:hypothetical protein